MASFRELVDNFDDNSTGSIWNVSSGAIERNNRLEMQLGGQYYSAATYNLLYSHVNLEIINAGDQVENGSQLALKLYDAADHWIEMYIYNNKLHWTWEGLSGAYWIDYNAATMKWIRIRQMDDRIYFEHSANGQTWTYSSYLNMYSDTVLENMAAAVYHVHFNGNPVYAMVDNFNGAESFPVVSDSGGATDSITVSLNNSPVISDTSQSTDSIVFISEVLEEPIKSYLYKVYDRGTFIGVWNDVANDISFEESINSSGDGIEVLLARNADRVTQQLEILQTESGEDLLTEDSQQLVATTTTANSVGPGTDVQINYDVEVIVFYGSSEELLTEDGEVILAEDGEPLLFDIGYVMGKPIFIGYISKIEATYGGDEQVRVSVLSYGKELDDYMVEVSDSSSIVNSKSGTSYGLGSTFTGENLTLAQTFTAAATGIGSRIRIEAALGDINYSTARLSYQLRTGSTIGGGTLLDSGAVSVSSTVAKNIDIPFHANPNFTNASIYHVVFSTDKSKAASGDPYPILISEGAAYGNGALYVGNPAGVYSTPGADLHFTLYTTTGATTAPFNSADPSAIDRTIIDDIHYKGSRITYDSSTVENTGTTVSYTFKNNTALEAVRKTMELAPTDWWWRVDVATAQYHKHPKPTTVSHTFILGKHIESLEVVQSIEGIVNMAYVKGGGTPPIYKRYENPSSINSYRRGLFRRSDGRIETSSALDLIGEHETTRFAEPRYASEIVILSEVYPIEDIVVGQLVGFGNFDNYIDDLQLQIVRKHYEPSRAVLTLDSVLPTVSKRIEDLRRNLQEVENADLPTTPS